MLNEIRCQQHTHIVNSSIIQRGLGEFLSPGNNYIRPAILDEEWNLCLARTKEHLTSSINNCSPTTIDLWSANLTAGWGYGNRTAGKMQTCWLNICWKPCQWPLMKGKLIGPCVSCSDPGRQEEKNWLTQPILAPGARDFSGLEVLAAVTPSSVSSLPLSPRCSSRRF